MTPPACFHALDPDFPVLYTNVLCPHYAEPGKSKSECVVALICSNEVFAKNVAYLQCLALEARGSNTRAILKSYP